MVGVGGMALPRRGSAEEEALLKAGLCTALAMSALDALARGIEEVRDNNQSRQQFILYHYTDKSGIAAIRANGVIRANSQNMVFVTAAQLNPTDAFNILFIGNPFYKGKGEYVVQFTPRQGTVFVPGTMPIELVHFGALRNGRNIDISYMGSNPFP
jgi:hypothetical protein